MKKMSTRQPKKTEAVKRDQRRVEVPEQPAQGFGDRRVNFYNDGTYPPGREPRHDEH